MVLEVSPPPDDKTIERAHRPALFQQKVDKVAPDEASAARHQVDSHLRCHHPCCVGDLMRSKATNFKLRASLDNSRVPQRSLEAGGGSDCPTRPRRPSTLVSVSQLARGLGDVIFSGEKPILRSNRKSV